MRKEEKGINKYKLHSEKELISLWREQGNQGALAILLNRYQIYSVSIANDIMELFCYAPEIDYEELVHFGTAAFEAAIRNFNGVGRFYPYWRIIARNTMIQEAKRMIDRSVPLTRFDIDSIYLSERYFYSEISGTLASDNYEAGEDLLREEIESFLSDEKNDISGRNQKMFSDYLDGYSIKDLATKYSLTYPTVKKIIDNIRTSLMKFLSASDN